MENTANVNTDCVGLNAVPSVDRDSPQPLCGSPAHLQTRIQRRRNHDEGHDHAGIPQLLPDRGGRNFLALGIGLLVISIATIIGAIVTGHAHAQFAYLLTLAVPMAIFALVLTLIHTFVRPFLSMLTGQWTLRSFGRCPET